MLFQVLIINCKACFIIFFSFNYLKPNFCSQKKKSSAGIKRITVVNPPPYQANICLGEGVSMKTNIFAIVIHLQRMLSTLLDVAFKTSSRRITQGKLVLLTHLQQVFQMYCREEYIQKDSPWPHFPRNL